MMGVEPIQEALKSGAQIVVAGRSSDTSIFSALPLLEGYAPAVVWHMAKILECGAAAVAVRTAPDCMMAELHEDSFDVFPLREDYHCTQQSVASHTLYENADPFELKEPSGTLRTDKARYEAISDRAERVSGSEFMHDREYTIKLEGVRRVRIFDDPNGQLIGGFLQDRTTIALAGMIEREFGGFTVPPNL